MPAISQTATFDSVLRLILCGAVAASLAALLAAMTSGDDNQPNPGITLVQAGRPDDAETAVAAERVEAFEQKDKSLAQVWLVAFGAGAFFLLELVSPLGIFYRRPAQARAVSPVPRFPVTERVPVGQRGVGASA